MKKGKRAAIAQRMRERWARLKAEQPEVWAARIARMRKNLSGKQLSNASAAISNAKAHKEKEPEEPGSPAQNLAGGSEHTTRQDGKVIGSSEPGISATAVSEGLNRTSDQLPDPTGAILARVSEIPINPKLVFARNDVCERFEVLVGRNSVLWVDCPIEIKPSLDFPGYYEFVGELPHGRWDRHYALRFERN